jgi:hypothetical protein
VVVLRVAHAESAVMGDAQLCQRLGEACALGHARRQDHQLAPVAHQLALESQLADRVEHDVVEGGLGRQEDVAAPHRDPAIEKDLFQRARHGPRHRIVGAAREDDRPVLRHHGVEVALHLGEVSTELGHDPAGDEHRPPPGPTELPERLENVAPWRRTVREGAVVVDRDRTEI